MNKTLRVALNVVLSIAISFIIYRFMTLRLIDFIPFNQANQSYLISIYIGVNLVQAIFIFIILNSIYSRKISKLSIISVGVIYFIGLIFVLFGRKVGVQGYEFNLFISFDSWISSAHNIFIALINALIFLPFAYIFRGVKSLKAIMIGMCIITLCEVAQYIFALGIFDIGDIVLNSFGFILGLFLFKLIAPVRKFA